MSYPDTTTQHKIAQYGVLSELFEGLLKETRELSKKKPEAILSANKVRILNRILIDLIEVLCGEPEAKFLEPLDDEQLPQASDCVLVMVQFESALATFKKRYFYCDGNYDWVWRIDEEE